MSLHHSDKELNCYRIIGKCYTASINTNFITSFLIAGIVIKSHSPLGVKYCKSPSLDELNVFTRCAEYVHELK